MPFKICTIGCGSMATYGHGPAYKRYALENKGDTLLAACCDLDENKARIFKENFGFARYYTDMYAMLDTEKPHGVCLVAPVSLTKDLTIEIIKRGYPVLMEKPPGLNRDETIEMMKAAEKYDSKNQVAFNRRYTPVIVEGIRMIREIGNIENIRYDFYRVNRKDPDFSTTTIHGIDTVKYIAGEDYEYVHFTYQEVPNTPVGNIYLNCRFKSGATAQINFLPAGGIVMERATVTTYDHTFFINVPISGSPDHPGSVYHYHKNHLKASVDTKALETGDDMFEVSGFYGENKAFFDTIKRGEKPRGDIASGLQSVEIADCIRNKLAFYKG